MGTEFMWTVKGQANKEGEVLQCSGNHISSLNSSLTLFIMSTWFTSVKMGKPYRGLLESTGIQIMRRNIKPGPSSKASTRTTSYGSVLEISMKSLAGMKKQAIMEKIKLLLGDFRKQYSCVNYRIWITQAMLSLGQTTGVASKMYKKD